MTTELTKAAQQALEALKHGVAQLNGIGIPLEADPLHTAIIALERALTQRPAAHTDGNGVSLPDGWVPLTIEYEPGYPEAVAFGPQRMMSRLKKWLDKHFAALAAQRPAAQTEREAFESRVTLNAIIKQYRIKAEDAHWLRASLPTQPAAQATPEPVGTVVAWLYTEEGETKFGHPQGHRPKDARPLVFGDTRPAPGVLDVEDLRDRLVAISSAVADSDDRAAQSMLSETLRLLAAQAKGAGHA